MEQRDLMCWRFSSTNLCFLDVCQVAEPGQNQAMLLAACIWLFEGMRPFSCGGKMSIWKSIESG